jgi:hypothetical protein
MELELRKIVAYVEDIAMEGGRAARPGSVMAIVAAVLRNPWHGLGFVEDLQPGIHAVAPKLGALLVPKLLDAVGGADRVEAYGKAAVVGTFGEVEHASALIHTLRFGNVLREAVEGSSFLPFTNKRAGPGCSIDVPLKHISAEGTRSHFLTASFVVPDGPAPDEIVVALGASTSGRPNARIGDRYEDMKAMGVDQTGRQRAAEPA